MRYRLPPRVGLLVRELERERVGSLGAREAEVETERRWQADETEVVSVLP
jgi:hypothetical protein